MAQLAPPPSSKMVLPFCFNPTAEVVDSDSVNFDVGLIQIRVATNSQPMDRLTIVSQGVSADQIGVNGSVVTYGGVPVGTWAGTTTLTVQLNAAATPAIAQAILRQVQFSHQSGGQVNCLELSPPVSAMAMAA